jgi:transcriptional regulator with XRE-family HTH domain
MSRINHVTLLAPGTRKNVTAALRDLRSAMGLSQEAFAHRLGKTVRTVARYESSGPIGWDALLELAAVAEHEALPNSATLLRSAAEELMKRHFAEYFGPKLERWLTLFPHADEITGIVREADAVLRNFDPQRSSEEVAELLALLKSRLHRLSSLLGTEGPRTGRA